MFLQGGLAQPPDTPLYAAAHHIVKVFISHGGLLSFQESIFHATPLLVLPIYGDQPRNGKFVENSGLGRMLVWEELTVDKIVDALTDIITNPKLVSLSSPVCIFTLWFMAGSVRHA